MIWKSVTGKKNWQLIFIPKESVNMTQNKFHIYIVASYCNTVVGWLIRERAKLKFWNRYDGDTYSHISLSLDNKLDNMLSFARKRPHNPLISGLVREDIHTGILARHPDKNEIAVFALPVSREQYQSICRRLENDWERRESLKYNFLGLFTMLMVGRGAARKDHYFCSQWVSEILQESGFDYWGGKKACHIRHFDIYIALRDYMVYEGCIANYPPYKNALIGDEEHAGTNNASGIL